MKKMVHHGGCFWMDRGWQPVFIGFCPDERAWQKAMKRFKVDGDTRYPPNRSNKAGWCSIFDNDGDRFCLITIHPKMDRRPKASVVALIVHECVHVWQEICEAMSEENPSAEFEASAIQVITDGMLEAYNQTRRKLWT